MLSCAMLYCTIRYCTILHYKWTTAANVNTQITPQAKTSKNNSNATSSSSNSVGTIGHLFAVQIAARYPAGEEMTDSEGVGPSERA
eukprot:606806-Heterocapsa_arctica.AAC.1